MSRSEQVEIWLSQVSKISLCLGVDRSGFELPAGPPSKYYPDPTMLNLNVPYSEQVGSSVIRPYSCEGRRVSFPFYGVPYGSKKKQKQKQKKKIASSEKTMLNLAKSSFQNLTMSRSGIEKRKIFH